MDERIESKIEELISEMTLDEKIGMIHGDGLFRSGGVPRLGIPCLKMSDGPMGVRAEFENNSWKNIGTTDDFVTYLPSNSAIASTWNRKLAYQAGEVLGEEARGRGKDMILAPGINVMRSPLCGRNFEYMSEDPYLIGEMAAPLIEGIQSKDVSACVKHFACNNQEAGRLKVDTDLSERALHEIYLPGFYAAVKKGHSLSIMGAYNRFRGEFACESTYLLKEILREKWKYDGVIVSDWGAVHHTKEAAESELDLEMSVTTNFDEYYMADPLKKAVEAGEIEETVVDEKVRNLLRLMFRLHMLDKEERQAGSYNTFEHQKAVLDVAREAVVLLKNEDERLPISKKGLKKIAVIGQNAEMVHSNGGGSAEIKALYEISPLMGIKKLLGGNTEVLYAKGYDIPNKGEFSDINWQESSLEEGMEAIEEKQEAAKKTDCKEYEDEKQARIKSEMMYEEAIALAKTVDEVIFVGGLNHDYDVEGRDRETMDLPYGQEHLIQGLLEANPNTVIVIVSGSPVTMESFADKAKAMIWSSYNGMQGGTALAEVLFGESNPSGKLPVTMPKRLSDSPAHHDGTFGDEESVFYKEGIFTGYRYYDTYQVEPLFAFGHGLSYTTFELGQVWINKEEKAEDVTVEISLVIRNSGKRDGKEVIQIYVSNCGKNCGCPKKELRAFEKVELKAGEERIVTFHLKKEAFSYYKEEKQIFSSEKGEYDILIGFASDAIEKSEKVVLDRSYYYGY
ncbi:MAG: glycosyl hydrolase [Lachnospiraceae bacterium]|nr:glycosyl hydrolase [Lachnospiraceae bacterium]